jgi:FAD/FMN-containing dehydrogenase
VTGLDGLRGALDGELLTPASPGYDSARFPAILRCRDVRPLAVVQCASTRDVAHTLAYARNTGTHVVPRGGGHCFAGRSSTEGLLLDLGCLDTVTVNVDGLATIGAGARLAKVYDALHERGRTVPAGCGPTVGIAGLTLGGGLGLLGRRHGLTCDALVGAQVVLADGRRVDCDADQDPELFWALRGAGGGQFGVVTSLVFATVPEPRATRFELRWPATAAAGVVTAWQDWAPDAHDDITANLNVLAEHGGPLRIVVFGAALRDAEATATLLDELTAGAGRPDTQLRGGMPVRDLKRSLADLDNRDGPRLTTSRSEFFARPLPAAAIAALLDELTTRPPNGRRELNFTAMGGAYNRTAPDATAFAHRSERFLLEHVGEDARWVDRSWAIAHAHGSGRVYPNFPDPQLDSWTDAYHGSNLARLVAVKHAYDPDRLFRFPQAL